MHKQDIFGRDFKIAVEFEWRMKEAALQIAAAEKWKLILFCRVVEEDRRITFREKWVGEGVIVGMDWSIGVSKGHWHLLWTLLKPSWLSMGWIQCLEWYCRHAVQGSRRNSLSSQPAMEMQDVFQPCRLLLAAQRSAIRLQWVQLLCSLMRTYSFNAEGAWYFDHCLFPATEVPHIYTGALCILLAFAGAFNR